MAYIDQGGGIEIRDITGNLILMDPGGTPTNVELTEEVLAKWMPVIRVKQLRLLPVDPQSLVPLVLDSPAAATGITWPIVRKAGQFLLYAREGEAVSFTVNHMQLASIAASEGPVKVTAPSGDVVAELNAEFQQQTPVSFVAPETGAYRISVSVGSNLVRLLDPSHPLVLDGSAGAINFVGQEKDLSLHVPEGTREFGVRLFGQGSWEDYYVDLRNIPPLLAPAGATLLVPAQ